MINLSLFYVILLVRVLNAFAVIPQAAATAIACDMGEDKESDQESKAGEVPLMPPRRSPSPNP